MDFYGSWKDIPELVLTKVYKFLNFNERLAAASTCKNWRFTLFQQCFWKEIRIDVSENDTEKLNFITSTLRHYDNVEIIFNPNCSNQSLSATNLLKILSYSTCLRSLRLRPQCCVVSVPFIGLGPEDYISKFFLDPILYLINHSPIQVLDLGGFERLTLSSSRILSLIKRPADITTLGFASLKEDPGGYPLGDLYDRFDLMKLTSLQIISLDFDLLTEDFLAELNNIKRLVIHVHGLEANHNWLSDDSWKIFRFRNPIAEVRFTLINALEAVHVLHSHLLHPSIPLTHLRVLFCDTVNVNALEFISSYYKETFQSLIWVDETYISENMDVDVEEDIDQFVIMAWCCKHLQELIIHGYTMEAENVVAIARLRGSSLMKLELSANNIIGIHDDGCCDFFVKEIEKEFGRPWHPKRTLHPALIGDTSQFKNTQDDYIYNITRNDLTFDCEVIN